jgi:hypothetical protein
VTTPIRTEFLGAQTRFDLRRDIKTLYEANEARFSETHEIPYEPAIAANMGSDKRFRLTRTFVSRETYTRLQLWLICKHLDGDAAADSVMTMDDEACFEQLAIVMRSHDFQIGYVGLAAAEIVNQVMELVRKGYDHAYRHDRDQLDAELLPKHGADDVPDYDEFYD